LSKATSSKIRIAETAGTGANTINVDDLYLDLNNNGVADLNDVFLGAVSAVAASDASATLTTAVAAYNTTGYVAAPILTTGSGQTGTVLVRVYTDQTLDATTAIAGTSFVVDVE
jgi:hypothetical protein